MKSPTKRGALPDIALLIHLVRDHRVILDEDLATVYGVATRRLNEQYRRNSQRFPGDFAFRLTKDEWMALRPHPNLKSQIATSSFSHGGRRKLPVVFTEHGAIMAANILNSPRAIQMSQFVVRAFVKMRTVLTDTRELAQKLAALEQELKGRLDIHEAAIVDVLQRIMKMLEPPPLAPEPPKPQIGFHIKEDGIPYRVRRRPARL